MSLTNEQEHAYAILAISVGESDPATMGVARVMQKGNLGPGEALAVQRRVLAIIGTAFDAIEAHNPSLVERATGGAA